MSFDMKKFDSYREDNRREVKKATDKLPNSVWETYSSFANCRGGVIILVLTEEMRMATTIAREQRSRLCLVMLRKKPQT